MFVFQNMWFNGQPLDILLRMSGKPSLCSLATPQEVTNNTLYILRHLQMRLGAHAFISAVLFYKKRERE